MYGSIGLKFVLVRASIIATLLYGICQYNSRLLYLIILQYDTALYSTVLRYFLITSP